MIRVISWVLLAVRHSLRPPLWAAGKNPHGLVDTSAEKGNIPPIASFRRGCESAQADRSRKPLTTHDWSGVFLLTRCCLILGLLSKRGQRLPRGPQRATEPPGNAGRTEARKKYPDCQGVMLRPQGRCCDAGDSIIRGPIMTPLPAGRPSLPPS